MSNNKAFREAWEKVERVCSGEEDPTKVQKYLPVEILEECDLWRRAFPHPQRSFSLTGRYIEKRVVQEPSPSEKQEIDDKIQFQIRCLMGSVPVAGTTGSKMNFHSWSSTESEGGYIEKQTVQEEPSPYEKQQNADKIQFQIDCLMGRDTVDGTSGSNFNWSSTDSEGSYIGKRTVQEELSPYEKQQNADKIQFQIDCLMGRDRVAGTSGSKMNWSSTDSEGSCIEKRAVYQEPNSYEKQQNSDKIQFQIDCLMGREPVASASTPGYKMNFDFWNSTESEGSHIDKLSVEQERTSSGKKKTSDKFDYKTKSRIPISISRITEREVKFDLRDRESSFKSIVP